MHGKTDYNIPLMIQGFCVTLILHIGVLETPGGCFEAIPGPYFEVYRVHIVIQSNLVTFWAHKNWFWHPFDDSRSLYDPITTNRGLRRPQEGVPSYIVHIIIFLQPHLVWFSPNRNWTWHPFDISGFCIIRLLPIGALETPNITSKALLTCIDPE